MNFRIANGTSTGSTVRTYIRTNANFFFECNEFFLTLLFDHTCRRTRIMRAWSNPQKRYISDPLRRTIFGALCNAR